MRSRFALLAAVSAALPAAAQPPAPAPATPQPVLVAGHDLKVRQGKATDWDKALKVGVELFKDPAGDATVAVTAAGQLAVADASATPTKQSQWASGLSLPVRTADQDKFTDAVVGVEVFKGAVTGYGLYLSDKGGLTLYPAGTGTDKAADFLYGLKLKVRKPGEAKFDEAKAFGVEAYKDNNTGGMVYVTETGSIAAVKAVPDKVPEAKDIKKPKPLYGLEAKVRRFDEPDFTDKTAKMGIEVFKDENTGTLLYISEAGSIAAVPPPAKMDENQKFPWQHAFILKARAGGESDLAKAKKYGVEVFSDRNTGYLVYISEVGSVAVLPKAAPK